MYKKFVASFMTALMAAMMLVSPALGATALKDYPTFLGKVGDFYVVVGKDAAASDVAGAIDVASNLAQLSYKETTTAGTTTAAGTADRKVVIPVSSSLGQIAQAAGGSNANQFPNMLRNFHYSGLKETKFNFKGTDHSYHEAVALPISGATLSLTHTTGTPINGTLKMRADNNATEYRFYFDDTISSADFSATSANSTTYTDPLKLTIAGREFQIVAVPDTTSFKALVGTVKTLSDGDSMTVGDLTLKVVQSYSTPSAKIEVTDASGNPVKSGINTGSTESFTSGGSTYNYKVLSSSATTSGVLGYAIVLFGKGDIEKVFDGTTTATVSEWGSNWVIAGAFTAAGRIQSGDFVRVTYNPSSLTDATRYFAAGTASDTFKGPGGYYEIKYAGYYPGKFAKVTIESVTGQTVYNSTAATGYSTATSLNGLKLSTDVAGTLVTGGSGYDEIYILFNSSSTTASWNKTSYWFAYKDKSTGRIVSVNSSYPAFFNTTGTDYTLYDKAESPFFTQTLGVPGINITLSYSGPGASATYTFGTSVSGSTLLNTVGIWNSSGSRSVAMAYQNRSQSSTTSAPELILGSGAGTADASDVQARVEASLSDVSTQVGDLITDEGVQVYTIKSNTEGNKVVVGIPPEQVYGLVQFGKATTTTTAGTTVKEVVAITTAVAKLDNEVLDADKTGKNLVLVGGPCKNSLVASLKTAGKFAYGCSDWPARNFAVIQVIDDAFATGKKVVVVAGTRAEDTRLASSVLQAYATKLSTITGGKVEVTGTALATATITAA